MASAAASLDLRAARASRISQACTGSRALWRGRVSHAECHARRRPCPTAAVAQPTLRSSSSSSASSQAAAQPPLPPYSLLSTPVYSLSTAAADGTAQTLNLVTYASPISLKPRRYALGLYEGTLSRDNMLATGRGLLQVRGHDHQASSLRGPAAAAYNSCCCCCWHPHCTGTRAAPLPLATPPRPWPPVPPRPADPGRAAR